jgi:hypothetical protein
MLWRDPDNKQVERLMQRRKKLPIKAQQRKDALKPWRRKYVMMILFLLGPLLWFPQVAQGTFTLPAALFTWLIIDPLVYYIWVLIRLWLVKREGKRTTNTLRHGPYGASMWSQDIEWRELENALALLGWQWQQLVGNRAIVPLVRQYLLDTLAARKRIHALNDRHQHGSQADRIAVRKAADEAAKRIAVTLAG